MTYISTIIDCLEARRLFR